MYNGDRNTFKKAIVNDAFSQMTSMWEIEKVLNE
jgi:hypothetical protein